MVFFESARCSELGQPEPCQSQKKKKGELAKREEHHRRDLGGQCAVEISSESELGLWTSECDAALCFIHLDKVGHWAASLQASKLRCSSYYIYVLDLPKSWPKDDYDFGAPVNKDILNKIHKISPYWIGNLDHQSSLQKLLNFCSKSQRARERVEQRALLDGPTCWTGRRDKTVTEWDLI